MAGRMKKLFFGLPSLLGQGRAEVRGQGRAGQGGAKEGLGEGEREAGVGEQGERGRGQVVSISSRVPNLNSSRRIDNCKRSMSARNAMGSGRDETSGRGAG
jgi:hypothetical protein